MRQYKSVPFNFSVIPVAKWEQELCEFRMPPLENLSAAAQFVFIEWNDVAPMDPLPASAGDFLFF